MSISNEFRAAADLESQTPITAGDDLVAPICDGCKRPIHGPMVESIGPNSDGRIWHFSCHREMRLIELEARIAALERLLDKAKDYLEHDCGRQRWKFRAAFAEAIARAEGRREA